MWWYHYTPSAAKTGGDPARGKNNFCRKEGSKPPPGGRAQQRECGKSAGSGEGGAYGAALVAGVGVGIWKDLIEASSVLREETRTLPIPENVAVYDKTFALYDKVYLALKDSFKELTAVR